jgi:two-component system NtrC family sensor kinase
MIPLTSFIEKQLGQTCKLSEARWAFLLCRTVDAWTVEAQFGLTKIRKTALLELLGNPEVTAWMLGALHSQRVRWRRTRVFKKSLSVEQMFAFPCTNDQMILLVGADGLTKHAQAYFRILLSGYQDFIDRPASHLQPTIEKGTTSDLALNPRQELLVELAANISSAVDSSLIAKLVVEKLRKLYTTDLVGIFLLTVDGHHLREFGGQYLEYPVTIPLETSLAGYVVETEQAIRIDDIRSAPRYHQHQFNVESALAVPMKFQGRTVGVIMLESEEKNRFTRDDQEYLGVISSQLSGIFEAVDIFRATREWANNLSLIHKVVDHIVGLVNESQVARVAAELLAEYFGYEYVIILVPDQYGDNLHALGVGGSMAHKIPENMSYSILTGITGRVFRTGQSSFSNDVSRDQDYFSYIDWVAGSEICVPLREKDQVIGVLNLESSAKNTFSESDQLLIESLAGILSSVLMNARRYQQLEGTINQLRAARETGLNIVGDLDLDILFNRVVRFARDLVKAKGAEIGLVDPGEQGIRVQTSVNPWYQFSGHLIPKGKGIAGQILATAAQVRVVDYNSWEERLWMGTLAPFRTAAGVPLKLKNQVIGTLVVMDDDPNRQFTDGDMQSLELIAQNIAIAIHNAQLYAQLEERMEAQKLAEARLIQTEKIATAGRLTASIAHEINNPLQALQNCLYLVDRNGISSDEGKEYLTMARSELDRLVATVQRMMDYYRPGIRDRELTDINGVIQRVLALMGPQLDDHQIRVQTKLDSNLPAIMVVSSQIQQVILNLVINAMEAMQNGGDLSIRTSLVIPQTRRNKNFTRSRLIEIEVSDTGPGISKEQRLRLFEPFASTKETGTGLGLAVSYGIIEAHGGSLALVENNYPGACFLITLPGGNES